MEGMLLAGVLKMLPIGVVDTLPTERLDAPLSGVLGALLADVDLRVLLKVVLGPEIGLAIEH